MEISGDSAGSSKSTDEIDSCSTLLQQLDNNLTDEEITEWISADGEDPGHQVLILSGKLPKPLLNKTQMLTQMKWKKRWKNIPVLTHGKAAEMLMSVYDGTSSKMKPLLALFFS